MTAPFLRVLLLALAFPALAAAQTAADPLAALEERVTDLETARNTLFAVTGATVVAIGLGWFRLVRRADQLARQHVDKLVATYPGAVERLVQEHETEARLRREAQVAVVSATLDLQILLREHGFRNVETVLPAAASSAALEAPSAVVLDLSAGLSQEAATALITRHPRDIFLAYSTASGRLDLPPGRTTFANSPFTLHARLMELLKFQESRRTTR